jgi:hypothetical protein
MEVKNDVVSISLIEELAHLKNVEQFVKDCQQKNDNRSILTLLNKIHNTGVRA